MIAVFGLLFVASIVAIIVGEVMSRNSEQHFQGVKVRRFGRIAAIVFAALWLLSMSLRVVPAGHRGVVFSRISGVQETSLNEGLNFVVPFISHVENISVRTNKLSDDLEAVTSDLQQMKFTVVVNYRPIASEVHKLYKEVGTSYVDIVLLPALNEITKMNTSKYNADAIMEHRQEVKDVITHELAERMKAYHIAIDDVALSNIRFSPEFEQAIEEKQVAEQQSKKKEYELEMARQDAEIAQTKARGEAEALKIKMMAEAEANLALDKSLTERILKYRVQMAYIERISDKVQIMVVPNESIPLLNMQDIINAK
ncbi:MAG: SPFH domain-containing protein [Bacillota bacterium]|jgi:regulator of protease activity HflC (stomatin/prohibitin superfamily)